MSLAGLLARPARTALERRLHGLEGGPLLLVHSDGSTATLGDGVGPPITVRVRRDVLYAAALFQGEAAVGEGYARGWWDCDDLVGLLELGVRNRQALTLDRSATSLLGRLFAAGRHRLRRNTVGRSRANIGSHYDAGNEFYGLILDPEMNYSAGIFPTGNETLGQAQRNKHELLSRKIGVGRGQHVLDIGCGWGAFAIHAARTYDCRVTGITISRQQAAFARDRIAQLGLTNRVAIELRDYRELEGQFDGVVSVGMLEHVGHGFLPGYFRRCAERLRVGGRACIQTIAVPEERRAANQRGTDWIQQRVFPGGELPSIASVERSLTGTGLILLDVEDVGLHFAETIHHWADAFRRERGAIAALGYGERFIRGWEFFLAACEAGFRERNQLDLQFTLERRR